MRRELSTGSSRESQMTLCWAGSMMLPCDMERTADIHLPAFGALHGAFPCVFGGLWGEVPLSLIW